MATVVPSQRAWEAGGREVRPRRGFQASQSPTAMCCDTGVGPPRLSQRRWPPALRHPPTQLQRPSKGGGHRHEAGTLTHCHGHHPWFSRLLCAKLRLALRAACYVPPQGHFGPMGPLGSCPFGERHWNPHLRFGVSSELRKVLSREKSTFLSHGGGASARLSP